MKVLFALMFCLFIYVLLPKMAIASDEEFTLIIQNHQFQPSVIEIPAGKKVRMIIENRDSTLEEFESYELNREKVVGANSKTNLFIGPLRPGRYPFYGEFNQKTAQGIILVK